jgi:hypothetical protein
MASISEVKQSKKTSENGIDWLPRNVHTSQPTLHKSQKSKYLMTVSCMEDKEEGLGNSSELREYFNGSCG